MRPGETKCSKLQAFTLDALGDCPNDLPRLKSEATSEIASILLFLPQIRGHEHGAGPGEG